MGGSNRREMRELQMWMWALPKAEKVRVCYWDKPLEYLVLPTKKPQSLEREALTLCRRNYDQRCRQESNWGFVHSKMALGGRQPRTAERLSSGNLPPGDSPVTPVSSFLEKIHILELPLSTQYKAENKHSYLFQRNSGLPNQYQKSFLQVPKTYSCRKKKCLTVKIHILLDLIVFKCVVNNDLLRCGNVF